VSHRWNSSELFDLDGMPFALGQKVAFAVSYGRAQAIEVREVTQIKNGRLYLGTKVPVNFPGRALIIS
jgi:hypothetical protein